MFDGKVKSTRQISSAGRNIRTDAKSARDLVENARKQREARAEERKRSTSAIKIQKIIRSKISRIHFYRYARNLFDSRIATSKLSVNDTLLLELSKLLPLFFNFECDINRLIELNKLLIEKLSTTSGWISETELNNEILKSDTIIPAYQHYARVICLSMETLLLYYTKQVYSNIEILSNSIVEQLLEVITISTVLFTHTNTSSHITGLLLCMYMTEHTSLILNKVSKIQYSSIMLNKFMRTLSLILSTVLSWEEAADPLMLSTTPTGHTTTTTTATMKELFHNRRKVIIYQLTVNLLTQPAVSTATGSASSSDSSPLTSTTASSAWISFLTAEDWYYIFSLYSPNSITTTVTCKSGSSDSTTAMDTSTSVSTTTTIAPATPTNIDHNPYAMLQLLSVFATTYLSNPLHLTKMYPTTITTTTTYTIHYQLGMLFVQLLSTLFSPSTKKITQNNNTPISSTSIASTIFSRTASNAMSNPVSSTLQESTEESLPLYYLVELLNSEYSTTMQKNPTIQFQSPIPDENTAMDIDLNTTTPLPTTTSSNTLLLMSHKEIEEIELDISEEHLTGYHTSTDWKKLEYHIETMRHGRVNILHTQLLNTIKPILDNSTHELKPYNDKSKYGLNNKSIDRNPGEYAQGLNSLVNVLIQRNIVTALFHTFSIHYNHTSTISSSSDSNTTTSSKHNEIFLVKERIHEYKLCLVDIYTQVLLLFPYNNIYNSTTTGDGDIGNNNLTTTSTIFNQENKSFLLMNLAFIYPGEALAQRLWGFIKAQYGGLLNTVLGLEDAAVLRSQCFQDYVEEKNLNSSSSSTSSSSSNTANRNTITTITTADIVYQQIQSAIYLFTTIFLQQLVAIDDETLLSQQSQSLQLHNMILPVTEIRSLTIFLKQYLYKLFWIEPIFDINKKFNKINKKECTNLKILKLNKELSIIKLFNHFCERNERKPFLVLEDYNWNNIIGYDLSLKDDTSSSSEGDSSSSLLLRNGKVKSVLTFIPQVIPFEQRVQVFQKHIEYDKAQFYSHLGYTPGSLIPGFTSNIKLNIRRNHIIEDSYEQLQLTNSNLKGQIKIEFISEYGMNEAGIDGGGLFKEFIDTLSRDIFHPSYGLFIPTTHQYLTPNPASGKIKQDHLNYYNFIGKLLGKALYENILLESEFSGGFLNILLDRKNTIDDLYYLDEVFYNSLMKLKHYANKGGDIDSLELYFETTEGTTPPSTTNATTTTTTTTTTTPVVHEIIPNGSSIKVTKHNIHAYIHQLSHYKLNIETIQQTTAIRHGFNTIIPIQWIKLFNLHEFQLLISGVQSILNIQDLKQYCNYASGYHETQPYIQAFWKILSELSVSDQSAFLKFVTSCSRQPLLGFSKLSPQFCIQKVPAYISQYTGFEEPEINEQPRLPTAATCMNLLKLPYYENIDILREKLLYAIRSNSGFELS